MQIGRMFILISRFVFVILVVGFYQNKTTTRRVLLVGVLNEILVLAFPLPQLFAALGPHLLLQILLQWPLVPIPILLLLGAVISYHPKAPRSCDVQVKMCSRSLLTI